MPFSGGDRHPGWKGDAAGQVAIHQHLRKTIIFRDSCEKCGKKTNRLDMAFQKHGISGYTRNPADYLQLCRSCHLYQDNFKAFCKEGHPLFVYSFSYRSGSKMRTACRICHNARNAQWRETHRLEENERARNRRKNKVSR